MVIEWIAGKIIGAAAIKGATEVAKEINNAFPLADVIKWEDYPAKNDDIVWKHPNTSIRWGSELLVNEYEVAAFFRDGKLYDVFRAGRHVITTANVPLLGRVFKKIYGEQVFQATVFFVSTRQFTNLFGGRTQTKESFPLMANGQFWYKITDATLFLNEVVGGQNNYTSKDVEEFVKGQITQNIIQNLAKYTLDDAFSEGLDTVSLKTKSAILDFFASLGIDVIDLKFKGLDTEDTYRQLLVYRKQGASMSEILKMKTVIDMSKNLGQSAGGSTMGLAWMMPYLFSQMPKTSQQLDVTDVDNDPLKILQLRFVKGEISEEEFEKKKKMLGI